MYIVTMTTRYKLMSIKEALQAILDFRDDSRTNDLDEFSSGDDSCRVHSVG